MFSLPDAILLPVLGHLTLVLFLFVIVSLKRSAAVNQGLIETNDLAHKANEPELSRRWANNLNNQFELPVFFYALVALLYATGTVNWIYVALAWVFLIGRILHMAVQVTTDNVALRGGVFTVNFLALACMWLVFFYDRFFY